MNSAQLPENGTVGRNSVSQQIEQGLVEDIYLKLPVFSGLLPWDKGLRGRTGINEALSVAFKASRQVIYLPLYPDLPLESVEEICGHIVGVIRD